MGVVAPGNKQIGTYNITLLKRSDKTVKLGAVSSTALVKYNQPPVSIPSASGFALSIRSASGFALVKYNQPPVSIRSASGFALVKYNQPPVSIRSASGFALVQRFEQRNENVYHPTNYGLNNTVV